MPLEPQEITEEISGEGLGFLRGCLVEGDSEQRAQERRVRRRALVISILLQSAALTVLVLIPLFGRTERIALKEEYIPLPPYGHPSSHPRGNTTRTTSQHGKPDSRFTFHPPTSKPSPRAVEDRNPNGPSDIGPIGNQPNDGSDCPWCVNIGGKDTGPRPPQPRAETHPKPRVVPMTQLDPAMLIHRVEPVYPPLARQTHREGRVELRAIIATDGSIQSLQIVGGDPMFYQSALDAVGQWRYRATVLNGQAVEIDTHITVIYTMQH